MALDTVESDTGQTRYQITENRLEKIRRAIVGNPDLVLNGAPVISGYVADVGRLPECLEALMIADSECGLGVNSAPVPTQSQIVVGGLRMGWRGPYLTTSVADGLPDGWGNGSLGGVNYGWSALLNGNPAATTKTSSAVVVDQFELESWGRDRANGGTAGSYDEDQAMVEITATDYEVDLNQVYFQVHVSANRVDKVPPPAPDPDPEVSKTYCLALLDVNPADVTKFRLIPAAGAGPTTITLPLGQRTSTGAQTFTFTANQTTTQGHRRLVLYETLNSTCLSTGDETDLGNASNPIVTHFGLLLAPRMAHTGTFSATVSIEEP